MTKAHLCLVVAAGCVPEAIPPGSSQHYLYDRDAHVTVSESVDASALELTHLFTERGYGLVDQHLAGPRGAMLMELKGNRVAVTEGGKHWTVSAEVGSVFYVWLTPVAGGTRIEALGKPTIDNLVPCTEGPDLPCDQIDVGRLQMVQMSGHDEAEVIHGVFAELTLLGRVVPAPPTDAEVVATRNACLVRRHQIFDWALTAKGDERVELLGSLPDCAHPDHGVLPVVRVTTR